MRYFVDQTEMKKLDDFTIKNCGLPGMVLMERAALLTAEEIMKRISADKGRILSVCGTGNNGADGIAIARILKCHGYQTGILMIGNLEKATADCAHQLEIARHFEIPVSHYSEDGREYDGKDIGNGLSCIVDAVFGIGLSREIAGSYAKLIASVNHAKELRPKLLVTAVDIPSGLMADTGKIAGICIKADLTVTFGYRKLGQILGKGGEFCGELVCGEVGFYDKPGKIIHFGGYGYSLKELGKLPVRSPFGHKGSFGKVLIVAGNPDMSGAACFSALASMRSGCGLVKVMTVKENREVIHSLVPEAILSVYEKEKVDLALVEEASSWADAIVFGPGMGQEPYVTAMLDAILRYRKESKRKLPMIIDADGIRVLAKSKSCMELLDENVILTPHMGEMAAASGKSIKELNDDPVRWAKSFAKDHSCILVMKNARTIVTSPSREDMVYINLSGHDALSTAGSGDVLTGVIASFTAVGMDAYEAAKLGVYVHGLAGEEAAKAAGNRYSVIARDIIEGLAGVFARNSFT